MLHKIWSIFRHATIHVNIHVIFMWLSNYNYRSSANKWYTPFILKKNKLSTNSSRDFNSVLETMNQYWIDPAKHFCPKSSYLSAIYESFKSKVLIVVESKNGHHIY